MSQLPSAFNSKEHNDMQNFTPVPEGDYVASIVSSELKDTKKSVNGSHKILNLTHEILQGEFKGRKFFNGLNIINPSAEAVKIANEALATICRAVGIVVAQNSEQLHGKPMIVSVKVKAADANWPAKNEVSFYKKMEGAGAVADTDGSSGPFEDEQSDEAAEVSKDTEEVADTAGDAASSESGDQAGGGGKPQWED